MICLVALSVGATFAADNATDVVAIDNEITIDEPLAVEQATQAVGDNESVTSSEKVYIDNSNINQYIGESGQIYENVTADELVFNGTFDNLNLTVERPITITGGIFNDPNFEIYSSNVILKNFSILQDKGYSSIFVSGISESNHTENVTITDVEFGFTDDQSGAGAVPVQVMYSDKFILSDSRISYTGKTNGNYVNNIIRIESSKNALIFNNEFIANLISVPAGWAEEPAGSGNWVSSPNSEGIVVKDSEGAIFDSNNITIYCSNFTGSYDTIYAVDFSKSNESKITNNKIIAHGNSYIYGIILSGDDFVIRANNISSTGVYYANGIDIEGPATGVVENNNINVKAVTSAYGIYSGMNGQNVSANYTGNNITGKAYNIFGFSLGDVESNVVKNYINLDGNYTTGLAARTGVLNVTENRIVLISSEEGNETISEGLGVAARGIFAMTGNVTIADNVIATPGTGVFLTGVDAADVENNFINVVANTDKDAYAIYAGVLGGLTVVDNNIDYEGATQGTGVNNALFISGTDDAIVANNNFTLDLVSSYVPWPEVPAGSGNWVKSPVSEGIVVKWSDNVIFDGNNVNVTYGDVVGSYDTIYVVDFVESNNAVITNNDINANGNSYIYGIIISGDDFVVRNNLIDVSSAYYANGIDVEGPATGVVDDNGFIVNATSTVYPIYSAMSNGNVSVNYTNNNILAEGYFVVGMELGDLKALVEGNNVTVAGNYTIGVGAKCDELTINNNTINSLGSNVGSESIWDSIGVETTGIKVKGDSIITNNRVGSFSPYAVNVVDTNSSVHDNTLVGTKYLGDASVDNADNAEVYNNTPIAQPTSTVISITEITGGFNVTGVLKDFNGTPIKNEVVNYVINGTNGTATTDENGVFTITNVPEGTINITFVGDSYLNSSSADITFKDLVPPTTVKVESRFNITDNAITITGYAVDTKAGEKGIAFATELLDADGKPIANVPIQFAVNNKIYNRTTFENGSFVPYNLNMVRAGRYTLALSFGGNDNYTSTFAVACFDLDKKPITIKASAKTFKSTAKTKKYTITVSTIVGSSADGKAHLRTGLKVTMKINGKTYTGKTKSNGQVTFNLKITKKGKFASVISFAGDDTYKSATKNVKITIK